MSAGKNTAGPWAWEEGQGDIKREWNGKKWTVATVSGCDLGWHEDRTCEGREAGANARLIAAAPELLEACIDALEVLQSFGLVARNVRAAIAKATGQEGAAA